MLDDVALRASEFLTVELGFSDHVMAVHRPPGQRIRRRLATELLRVMGVFR